MHALPHATPHSDITDKHRRLAEITEMIHTASLVHDDVLDDCDTRRGKEGRGEEGGRGGENRGTARPGPPPASFLFVLLSQPRPPPPLPLVSLSPLSTGQTTVNSLYGTRVAVLAGDFLFAQSSWFLANLDNLEVIKLISQVCVVWCERKRSE